MNTTALVTLYGITFLLIAGRLGNQAQTAINASPVQLSRWQILAWLAVGIAMRVPNLWDTGFHYDTGTYKAWALTASDPADLLGVYANGHYTDHPPLFMYGLAVVGGIARALSWETSTHFTALIKLPMLISDVLTALILLRVLRREGTPLRALGLASLYWLNPALIFISAKWGQTDSLLCLLLVLAWDAWARTRLPVAAAMLALAVAFKPQGALYAGVFVLALLVEQRPRVALVAIIAGIATYAAVVLPFAWSHPPEWLLTLYLGQGAATDPNYITVNAYNIWALFGLNWQTDVGALLGISTQSWAIATTLALLSALALTTGLKLRHQSDAAVRGSHIAWAFVLATIILFMLAPKMHERYIFMLVPFTLLLAPPRARIPLMLVWTVSALANIAYVYAYYIDLKSIAPHDTPFIRINAAFNLAATLLTLIYWRAPQWPARFGLKLAARLPQWPEPEMPAPDRWSIQHSLAVAGLIGAALGIGLYRVGAIDYPVNGIVSDGFAVEYQYAEPADVRFLVMYTGEKANVSTPAKLSLQRYDSTNDAWIDLIVEREFNDFYHFYDVKLDKPGLSTRYRVRTSGKDWRINELGLLGIDGAALPPTEVVSVDVPQAAQQPLEQSDYSALTDEQSNWIHGRGYLAGTYFDEIYHPRTGYEFVHQIRLYDHTHPPLGKWPIMASIETLGMTPFGWRFSSVLASALTVGVLAWGGWLIAGNLAALLLAGGLGLFEFSRFTIGRYGTIDGWLGLYLLLSFLFLWRVFIRTPHADWRDGWKLSPNLLAAGGFLGAAIAVKWSAFYGGIGVFLLFAFSLLSTPAAMAGTSRLRSIAPRMLGAALAFGLLPALVYWLSYLPFMRCMEGSPALWSAQGWHEFVKSQQYIYNYHSQLTDTHPFASAFWTWPLSLKPLWIFTGEGEPRTAISILGNPLIWWGGLLAIFIATRNAMRKVSRHELALLIAWAALFLPWAMVSRAAFIYHYYPAALILVLLLTRKLMRWSQLPRLRELPLYAVLVAGGLFSWFYPTISGHPAPLAWFQSLRWFPTWWML